MVCKLLIITKELGNLGNFAKIEKVPLANTLSGFYYFLSR